MISNEENAWRELAKDLKFRGDLSHFVSKSIWRHFCISFLIKGTPFWVTCYTTNFGDLDNRGYGIFISHTGYFDDRDKTNKTRSSEEPYINSLKALVLANKEKLSSLLPNSIFVNEDMTRIAADHRLASTFSSDSEAMSWLEEMLDKYLGIFAPLMKEVMS